MEKRIIILVGAESGCHGCDCSVTIAVNVAMEDGEIVVRSIEEIDTENVCSSNVELIREEHR